MTLTITGAADKISLICIWLETALWGINTVVFLGTCWILFRRKQVKRDRWVLALTSVVLYIVATIDIAASVQQLLGAFIYQHAPEPLAQEAHMSYASAYFQDESQRASLLKNLMYVCSVLTQNSILVWRLYIVWGHNAWALAPLLVEVSRAVIAYVGVGLLAAEKFTVAEDFAYISWSLDIAINVVVTTAIAARLWYMSRRAAVIASRVFTPSNNVYMTAMTTIIESGAISAAASIALLVLLLSGSPAALPAVSSGTQLAVLVPLMIIVRVGLGLTHGLPLAYKSYLENGTQNGETSTGAISLPLRRKATDFAGQISVQREIATDLTMTISNDVELAELKGSESCDDSASNTGNVKRNGDMW